MALLVQWTASVSLKESSSRESTASHWPAVTPSVFPRRSGFKLQTLVTQLNLRKGEWYHDWDFYLPQSKQVVKSNVLSPPPLTHTLSSVSGGHFPNSCFVLAPCLLMPVWCLTVVFPPEIRYVLIGSGIGLFLVAGFIIVIVCIIRKQVHDNSTGEVMGWVLWISLSYTEITWKWGGWRKYDSVLCVK